MDSHNSFLLGGALVAIVVVIAWLASNLMRAERVILSIDKETKEIKDSRLVECATYPYINTYLGIGYGHPFWLMRARPSTPYYVTV